MLDLVLSWSLTNLAMTGLEEIFREIRKMNEFSLSADEKFLIRSELGKLRGTKMGLGGTERSEKSGGAWKRNEIL